MKNFIEQISTWNKEPQTSKNKVSILQKYEDITE